MKSLATMLNQCAGLLGTHDITEWENHFLNDMIARRAAHNGTTTWISEKQAEMIERIYNKHFA